MVYALAEGDITKEDCIMDNVSFEQATRWMLLRRFDNYSTEKRAEARRKKR